MQEFGMSKERIHGFFFFFFYYCSSHATPSKCKEREMSTRELMGSSFFSSSQATTTSKCNELGMTTLRENPWDLLLLFHMQQQQKCMITKFGKSMHIISTISSSS
jgi:hypothetical protein